MELLASFIEKKLSSSGLTAGAVHPLQIAISISAVIAVSIISNYALKLIIKHIIKKWIDRSDNQYDDIFYNEGVFNRLSHIAPIAIILTAGLIPLREYPAITEFVKTGMYLYLLAVILKTVLAFINAIYEIYNILHVSKTRPITGYVQFGKVTLVIIGIMLALSIILKKDISSLLAGITAFAAVLMFVFKDVIMGIIAGIQISANDIVRVGDSIEMPKRDTEGKVIDITLNTVKVLNSNRTISTIPAYALVSESFQNWRGLEITGGRRIKRTINIDMRSISFAGKELIGRLTENPHIAEIIARMPKETLESSQLTNLGLFCVYLEGFLRANPQVNGDAIIQVRHIQPTENGLPLEVLAYSNITESITHESLQNKIFEHIYATIGEFNLRVFQRPTT
jgi:miniconductance mechanosensitive channel